MTQSNDPFLSTTSASTGPLLDITLKNSIVATCVAVNTKTILAAEFVGIMFVVYLSQISLAHLRCFSFCRHQTESKKVHSIQRPCYFETKELQLRSATLLLPQHIAAYIILYISFLFWHFQDISLKTKMNFFNRCLFAIQIMIITIYIMYYAVCIV